MYGERSLRPREPLKVLGPQMAEVVTGPIEPFSATQNNRPCTKVAPAFSESVSHIHKGEISDFLIYVITGVSHTGIGQIYTLFLVTYLQQKFTFTHSHAYFYAI